MVLRAVVTGFLLLTLSYIAADEIYVVQRHDTLTGIAREHGVTVSQLASHNGLRRDYKVKVGQRLRIPDPAGTSAPQLATAVQNAISDARVQGGRWKYIVVHHSGTSNGNVRGMDRYHREQRHMENGLAYHFVIGNGHGMRDGEVAVGDRWKKQLDGGHLASEPLNRVSVGICLVGNFDKESPTPAQLKSLRALVSSLRKRCKLGSSAVKTHQQINPVYTRCPGRHFPRSVLK
jgi:LysM repeat protein